MQLPVPTTEVATALEDLATHGVAHLARVLGEESLIAARDAMYAAARADDAAGGRGTGFALDTNAANQRVWNLLRRHDVFASLAAHPVAIELVREVLGWPALLSNISGNITGPGTTPGVLHADQVFVPEPWPERPQGLNLIWCLDDFTEQNGGTRVTPGSHRLNRNRREGESAETVCLEAEAGSVLAFESRVWHQTGANRSQETRAGVFAFYSTPVYRTQENWFLTLNEEFVDNASDELLTLLAYKSTGFGLANGRSPR